MHRPRLTGCSCLVKAQTKKHYPILTEWIENWKVAGKTCKCRTVKTCCRRLYNECNWWKFIRRKTTFPLRNLFTPLGTFSPNKQDHKGKTARFSCERFGSNIHSSVYLTFSRIWRFKIWKNKILHESPKIRNLKN